MKIYNRITAWLLCLFTVACFFCPEALAAQPRDLGESVGLTLYYRDEDTPVTDVSFQIYLVATLDATGKLNVIDPFLSLLASKDLDDPEQWQAIADSLEGYVLRDQIPATDSGKTDQNGVLIFPSENRVLAQGLYLVLGESHTQDGIYYESSPFLVTLPAQDPTSDGWLYRVGANVKYESFEISEEPEFTTRKVLKIWNDEGYESQRPKDIVVQLLRDGQLYASVTLNQENNWRYTWTKLESGHKWTVVEQVPNGYRVLVDRVGNAFLLTNTPQKAPPTTPTTPTTPSSPSNPSTPTTPSLPQTGQLWWPVPLLICVGLLFILAGLLRRRSTKYEK